MARVSSHHACWRLPVHSGAKSSAFRILPTSLPSTGRHRAARANPSGSAIVSRRRRSEFRRPTPMKIWAPRRCISGPLSGPRTKAHDQVIEKIGTPKGNRTPVTAVKGALPAGGALHGTIGGWGGIRTHGRVAPTPVFKTGALNRSATHPYLLRPLRSRWRRFDADLYLYEKLFLVFQMVGMNSFLVFKTGALNRSAIPPM
jgi:hypothetical protein